MKTNVKDATPPVPTTLSDLLLMAVDDAEQIEQQEPGYTLNMNVWHSARYGGCHVCMAGAVMARRLGANPTTFYTPASFPHQWQQALFAVDAMRSGRLVDAYAQFTGGTVDAYAQFTGGTDEEAPMDALLLFALGDRIQDAFDDDMGRAPWYVYREVAASLQEAGL